MRLNRLQLNNFKNYGDLELKFPAQVNFLLGLNGSGKTNLLEAIYCLSATKGFAGASDTQNIKYGADFFYLRGEFENNTKIHEVFCQVQPGRKKIFREDSRDYEKMSEHVGRYPVVLISPLDVDLVKESSDARRRFFDQMISQVDHVYLEALLEYHHALKQRNALLKMFAEQNNIDYQMIDLYNQQLSRTGKILHEKRKAFASGFLPLFNKAYALLVDEQEEAALVYSSGLESKSMEEGLKSSLKKDLVLQRTTFGIHRDDYMFGFAHGELKRLGSQGQQKSFLVAVKLAQVEVIKEHLGFSPILLLDDIFDKLDDTRIARLLQIVSGADYGQAFITDAGPERTLKMMAELNIPGDIFEVEKGTIRVKQKAREV
ncbi:MAG: DNA replication/repair protein RecF [Cyclobacteriaceae bacterium]|nr:DNA replication/repair protein RecF [Cyclobacteriaceae bacterium]